VFDSPQDPDFSQCRYVQSTRLGGPNNLLFTGIPGTVSQHVTDHSLKLIANIQIMLKLIILRSFARSCHGAQA
jgi:hypothetical protein